MRKKLKFDSKEYSEAVRYFNKNVQLLDQTIHDLCAEHPDHKDPASVHAKVWIIARTLSSGLERTIKSKGIGQGGALTRVRDEFLKNGKRIDDLLADLKGIQEPLSAEKLRQIVSVHGEILRLLQPIARKPPRSFVSKYLHFHNSAVPIYDRMANRVLRDHQLLDRGEITFPIPRHGDEDYARHTMRFLRLYDVVSEQNLEPSAKHLDSYLLSRWPSR